MGGEMRIAPEDSLIEGSSGKWEVIVGMEVHAQLLSNSKLFSGSEVSFGGEPNTRVSLFDAAIPGVLPVVNEACIRLAVRAGLGLKAQINLRSIFERKHYFYPDLPHGYQITQYAWPIVGAGSILLDMPDGSQVVIGIERLHLEQDAGKLIHDVCPGLSCVDLNRAGVALIEIVSKPDMRSASEARAYLTKLRAILRTLGVCNGNMEEGSMRADVNLSVRRPGLSPGTPCEIKNINSIRFIGQAIEYEARRQIRILEAGETVHRETRLFDRKTGETRPMRSKEVGCDYRYFPDPDLPPLVLDQAFVDEIAGSLPELPDERRARFIHCYGLKPYDASILVTECEVASFFEEVAEGRDAQVAASWITNELFGRLNEEGLGISESRVSAHQLGGILDLIREGVLSGKIAKDLFEILWSEGGDPREIVESRGMRQMTDIGEIERIVSNLIEIHADKVDQVKRKPALLGWFIGQVMIASDGRANPQLVNEILKEKFYLS